LDIYTKAVLSVIAVALMMIALQNIGANAQQTPGITKVIICDPDHTSRCLGLTEDGKVPTVAFPPR
jgi:hypothetical protein